MAFKRSSRPMTAEERRAAGLTPKPAPYLDAAANAVSGEVWALFEKIRQTSGSEMAIELFKWVIEVAHEQEQSPRKDSRMTLRYPTMEKVAAADQRQICIWYLKLCEPQANAEKAILTRIKERYLEFRGATRAIMDEISRLKPPPPTKRKGPHQSERGNLIRSDLLALFNENNPNSQWSLAKQGRLKLKGGESPQPLTKEEFASLLVPAYGASGQHILRKLKYLRTKK